MQNETLTREELQKFKPELIEEIKRTARTHERVTYKQYLRSSEVRKLLKILSCTFQNLCIKGILPFESIGGIFYYTNADILQLLGENSNSSWGRQNNWPGFWCMQAGKEISIKHTSAYLRRYLCILIVVLLKALFGYQGEN